MSSMYGDLARPPLSAEALTRAVVGPGSLWTEVAVLGEVTSTNAVLARRASAGGESGAVLVAERQTSGRGRLDRTWMAPARSGLTMSVLLRPYDVPLVRWPWIPLLSGLAVAAALRQHAGVEANLKWPNDVLIGERKVAGLLVERVDSPGTPAAAVIGIGLNVTQAADELPVPQATSLRLEDARTIDRSVLARSLLRSLERLWTAWQRAGGDPGRGLHKAYVGACQTLGRRVRVELTAGEPVEGEAVAVDGSGRLHVRTPTGVRAFGAADVLHVVSQT